MGESTGTLIVSIVISSTFVVALFAGIVYRCIQRYRRTQLLKVLETTQIYEIPVSSDTKVCPEEQTNSSRGISEDLVEAQHISDNEDSIDRSDFIKKVFAVEGQKIPRRRKINKLNSH